MAAALVLSPAWADDASPAGLWQSIDDVTGKPRALIRITETNGVLQGRLEKLLRAPQQNPKCVKCQGANKDRPLLGMAMMWDVTVPRPKGRGFPLQQEHSDART